MFLAHFCAVAAMACMSGSVDLAKKSPISPIRGVHAFGQPLASLVGYKLCTSSLQQSMKLECQVSMLHLHEFAKCSIRLSVAAHSACWQCAFVSDCSMGCWPNGSSLRAAYCRWAAAAAQTSRSASAPEPSNELIW